METRLLGSQDHALAAGILQAGGLVVMPTETVYGLAANAYNSTAVRRIFEAKGRPQDNPVIVHIAGFDKLGQAARNPDKVSVLLAKQFWPGPVTIILEKDPRLAQAVSAGLDSVGVRVPAHAGALELLSLAGLPLAAPSANRSGRPSPTSFDMALAEMNGRVDAIVDGGPAAFGIESTIVRSFEGILQILRPGAIGPGHLRQVLDAAGFAGVEIELSYLGTEAQVPGSRHPHYRPASRVLVFENVEELARGLADESPQQQPQQPSGAFGILYPKTEVPNLKNDLLRAQSKQSRGRELSFFESANLAAYAQNLYLDLVRYEASSQAPVFLYLPQAAPTSDADESALQMALRDRILRAADSQKLDQLG